MAKNIYNNNKPSAKVSLNGFDGGQFQVYSMKAGIGNPCFFMPTNPKFKCRLNVQNFMMAENLRQNAFLRAKQNIDFFFVPYRQLYHKFSDIYYGRSDSQSKVLSEYQGYTPCFSLSATVSMLFQDYCFSKFYVAVLRILYTTFISNANEGSEYASYSFDHFVKYLLSTTRNERANLFAQVCGNFAFSTNDLVFKTYTCLLFNKEQITDYKGTDQNIFWEKFLCDLNYTVEDNLRVLDMLGYGNYFADFDYYYHFLFYADTNNNVEYYIEHLTDSSPVVIEDYSDILLSAFQTFQDVDFGHQFVQYVKPNAFNLLAYQKIFDNVYRNSILSEPFKFGEPLVSSFNADGIDEELDSTYGLSKFVALCVTPYFIQHRRNITNGLWNSPAFGGNINVPTNDEDASYEGEHDSGTGIAVSIPDLRLGFAMQQFRERLLRCGTREKDLLRGLFGTKSRYISDEYVYYIGSFDGTFNVNTVQDVSGDNLGRLGGNIMSSVTGNQLEFSTEEFGVIIGIHTVLPTMVYPAFGIDLVNRKSEQFDFFHPDFENLGLQPVFYDQFNNVPQAQDNKVVGYAARFIEYKQKLDLSHGLFADGSFDLFNDYREGSPEIRRGADSDYVTNFDNSSIGTLSAQYVSPYSLDNIFDTLTDYSIYSDHFKCWLNVKCDMLQPMSVLGLPQLS